jgi:heme/copper-type cytochrome/quinol oxidase subunit 4
MEWIIGFVLYVGLTGLIITFMMSSTRKDKESRNEL